MIHHRQGLTFRFEASDDGVRVHAGLDDFQSDFASHRSQLFGHEDDAEAAFADLLQQLVTTDFLPGASVIGLCSTVDRHICLGRLQKTELLFMYG